MAGWFHWSQCLCHRLMLMIQFILRLEGGAEVHVSSLPEEDRKLFERVSGYRDPQRLIPRPDEAALLNPELIDEIQRYLDYQLRLLGKYQAADREVEAAKEQWGAIPPRARNYERKRAARDAYYGAIDASLRIGEAEQDTYWTALMNQGNLPYDNLRRADTRQILPATASERGEAEFLYPEHARAYEKELRERMNEAWKERGYQSAAYFAEQDRYYKDELDRVGKVGGSREMLVAAWSRETPKPLSPRDRLVTAIRSVRGALRRGR